LCRYSTALGESDSTESHSDRGRALSLAGSEGGSGLNRAGSDMFSEARSIAESLASSSKKGLLKKAGLRTFCTNRSVTTVP
jgi:hypothetical protein